MASTCVLNEKNIFLKNLNLSSAAAWPSKKNSGICQCVVKEFIIFFLYFLSVPQSDDGWLHKAVEVEGQLHIIEELQVFDEQQPITNVVISGKLVRRQTVNSMKKVLSF